jgi:CBS domain-containing protein
MNTVKDILAQKGHDVWTIEPTANLLMALQRLRTQNVGALLVMEGSSVKGIISERDFAWRIAEKGSCSLDQSVAAWMTKEVMVVSSDTTINDCMQLMSKAHIRHLPVVDDGDLVGLISIGDVVRALIAGQQATIAGLENYILSQTHEM